MQTLGIRQLRTAVGRWSQQDISMRVRTWFESTQVQHQDKNLQQLEAYTAAIEKETENKTNIETQVKQVRMAAGIHQLRHVLWREAKGNLRSRFRNWEAQKRLEQTAQKQLQSLDAYTEAILKQTQLQAPLTRLNQSLMGLESLATISSSPIIPSKPGGSLKDVSQDASRVGLEEDKENMMPMPEGLSPLVPNTPDETVADITAAAASIWPDRHEVRGLKQIGGVLLLLRWQVITTVSAVSTWRNSAAAALRERQLVQQHTLAKLFLEDQHSREVQQVQQQKILARQRAAEVDAATQEWNAVRNELESARKDRDLLGLELECKSQALAQVQSDLALLEAEREARGGQRQDEGTSSSAGMQRLQDLETLGVELVTTLRARDTDQMSSTAKRMDESGELHGQSTPHSGLIEQSELTETVRMEGAKIEIIEQQLATAAATEAAQQTQPIECVEPAASVAHAILNPASSVMDDVVIDEEYAAAERAYLEYSTEYLNVNTNTSVREESVFQIDDLEHDDAAANESPHSPIEHQLLHVQMELHGLSRSLQDSSSPSSLAPFPRGKAAVLEHVAATLSMLPQTWPVPQLQGDNFLSELMASLQPRLDCVAVSPMHQRTPMREVGARFEALTQGLEHEDDRVALDALVKGLQGIDAWAADLYGTLRGLAMYELQKTKEEAQSGQDGGELHGIEGILLEVARQIGGYPTDIFVPENSYDIAEWSSQLLTELTCQDQDERADIEAIQADSRRDLLLNLSEKTIQMKIALTSIIPWAQDCRAEAMIAMKERDAAFMQRDGSMLQVESQLEVIEAMEKEIQTARNWAKKALTGSDGDDEIVRSALNAKDGGEASSPVGGNAEELHKLQADVERQFKESRKM